MAEPPSESGALQETFAEPPVPEPLTDKGSDGVSAGVTELDAAEAEVEPPALLVAVDVNVYAVPLVRDEIVQLVPGAVMVQVAPPGEAVTV